MHARETQTRKFRIRTGEGLGLGVKLGRRPPRYGAPNDSQRAKSRSCLSTFPRSPARANNAVCPALQPLARAGGRAPLICRPVSVPTDGKNRAGLLRGGGVRAGRHVPEPGRTLPELRPSKARGKLLQTEERAATGSFRGRFNRQFQDGITEVLSAKKGAAISANTTPTAAL